MGRVFSWNDVSAGKVPALESFPLVTLRIREELERAPGVTGGILCGAAAYGKYNIRSDVDCLVAIEPDRRVEVVGILQEIHQFASLLHVPVEFIVVDVDLLEDVVQFSLTSFMRHLRFCVAHGGMIKSDILPLFKAENRNGLFDLREYMRHKMQQLQKALYSIQHTDDDRFTAFLENILQTPMHVARGMLAVSLVPMPNDSKVRVIEHYPNCASDAEAELFQHLCAVDATYTSELLRAIRDPSFNDYDSALRLVKHAVWDVIAFLRMSALRLFAPD